MRHMRLRAPAKINLHLRVGPVEADGFHPLSSWMVTVGLFDSLTLEPRDDKAIEFSCDQPTLPTDDRNLVVRAAKMLRDSFPQTSGVETGGAGSVAILAHHFRYRFFQNFQRHLWPLDGG